MTDDALLARESELYPHVRKWLDSSRFNCFASDIEVGLKYGRVDVVGIVDSGRDLAAYEELVAIEVKPTTSRFAASVGQAYGYGVYADRCYLACGLRSGAQAGFTSEERQIAAQMGVGLLSIRAIKGRVVIREDLPSRLHQPIEGLRLEIIAKLNYSLCAVCRSLFRSGKADPSSPYSEVVRLTGRSAKGSLARAIQERKGIMYWLTEASERDPRQRPLDYRRRFICRDCVWALRGDTLALP